MKIMKWLTKEFTKTPGYMRVNLSLLTILAISSVSSTALLISRQAKNTSEENILPVVESLEVAKVNGELRVRVTGKNTTEVLTNLSPMLKDWAEKSLSEKSYPSTPLKVK